LAYQDAANIAGDLRAGSINNTSIGASTASTGSFTSLTDSGNLAFTGTGNRITGDFSNATQVNRVAFQTSTASGATVINVLPGSGAIGSTGHYYFNDPSANNCARFDVGLLNAATEARLSSGIVGSGTYLPMTFLTGGSERVRIDTSGNVGIGVSPSAWGTASTVLELKNGATFAGFASKYTLVGQNAYTTASSDIYINNGFASQYYQVDGTHVWRYAPSGTAGASFSYAEAMRIDSSGNVGIGTSSPTQPLDVNGNVAITGTARRITGDFSNATQANRVLFQTSTTNSNTLVGYIPNGTGTSTATRYFNSSSADNCAQFDVGLLIAGTEARIASGITGSGTYVPITFSAGGSERVRIDTSGNLLAGTTSASASNSMSIILQPSAGLVAAQHVNGTASGVAYAIFNYNGGAIGSITQSGTTAVSYNTSSDYRLKHDIQPMTGALAKVAQLKPVTYKWNADDSESQGFIAHELQEVVPECVTGEKDAVDADGNPQYQGIDTSFLVATLAAAIQELKGINDAQAQIITALTARVEALEAK
jgi:hypothetical protein